MAGANAVFTGEQMLTTPCTCLLINSAAQVKQRKIANEARCLTGSPWDEDKVMMSRWGLDGMQSFEQVNVARKEGAALAAGAVQPSLEDSEASSPERLA